MYDLEGLLKINSNDRVKDGSDGRVIERGQTRLQTCILKNLISIYLGCGVESMYCTC